MTTVEVKFRGVNLYVKGKYTPEVASSYDYSGDGAEFEIHSIVVGMVEIIDLLEEHINEIEDLCIQQLR